ncbi:MAG: phosphate ABC transporter permease PstA [Chloroflexota bacterium]
MSAPTLRPPPPRSAPEAVEQALIGHQRDWRSVVFELGLLLSLLIAVGILVWLIADIFIKALPVFQERPLIDFLTGPMSSNPRRAGIGQALFGSVALMVFVAMLAIPIGIAAAVYLEEYAPDNRLTRLINTTVRNLAGVPAVVYGLLGIALFVVLLRDLTGGRSIISGGFTLAIVVLPIVIITSAESLRSVPTAIREAGYGVGATKWEVVRSHVLPYAMPGILTGTILTIGRAFGETAPLLLVGAVTGGFAVAANASVTERLQGPYTTLPTLIFSWARQPRTEFRELTAAAIIVLLVVVLLINAIAIILRNRYARTW